MRYLATRLCIDYSLILYFFMMLFLLWLYLLLFVCLFTVWNCLAKFPNLVLCGPILAVEGGESDRPFTNNIIKKAKSLSLLWKHFQSRTVLLILSWYRQMGNVGPQDLVGCRLQDENRVWSSCTQGNCSKGSRSVTGEELQNSYCHASDALLRCLKMFFVIPHMT